MPPAEREVTRLLKEWSQGDPAALELLMPVVFDDLRQMARKHFRMEPADHTLQPTALVSEVYLRLLGQRQVRWDNRRQFFAFVGTLMRRILVDHAKARHTAKRGGGLPDLPLDEAFVSPEGTGVDVVALDEALSRLAELDPRQARVVELRFFVGLTNEETAAALEISLTSVKRDWQTAKLWLYNEMNPK